MSTQLQNGNFCLCWAGFYTQVLGALCLAPLLFRGGEGGSVTGFSQGWFWLADLLEVLTDFRSLSSFSTVICLSNCISHMFIICCLLQLAVYKTRVQKFYHLTSKYYKHLEQLKITIIKYHLTHLSFGKGRQSTFITSSENEAVSRKAKKNWRVFPPGYAHFACFGLCFFSRNSAPGNSRLITLFPSFLKLYSPSLHTQQGLSFLTPWSNFLNSHCTVWITLSQIAFFWLREYAHTHAPHNKPPSCPDKRRGGTRCSPIAHRNVSPL